MTNEIKRELIGDIKEICSKFGILQIINDDKRDEITTQQYENLKFPIVFYNIYIENSDSNNIVCFENGKYRFDEEIQVLLTLESRERVSSFNMLYMFLSATKATNDFFRDRKHKRKIRKVYKIQETPFEFLGRKYYKQVLQFSYFAEHLINKDFKEE